MRLFDTIKNGPPTERGIVIGGYLGAAYAFIREGIPISSQAAASNQVPLNVYMAGRVADLPIPAMMIIATVLGGYIGSNIGFQLGQYEEIWRRRPSKHTDMEEAESWFDQFPYKTILMRSLIFVVVPLSVINVAVFKDYAGKLLFFDLDKLTFFDIYGITIPYAAQFSISLGLRVGNFLDILLGPGIARFYRKISNTERITLADPDFPAPVKNDTILKRFRAAPPNEKGVFIGFIAGALYMIRSAFTKIPLNVPQIGPVSNIPLPARLTLGMSLGAYTISTFANRYGQCIEAWQTVLEKDELPSNRLFLLRILPFVVAALGVLILSLFHRYGGKPLFDHLDELFTPEVYLITALFSAYIGGTVALRAGTFLDVHAGTLVADLGLFRLGKALSKTRYDGYEPLAVEIEEIPSGVAPVATM